MQAWKTVIPSSKSRSEPRVQEGHEWLYDLSVWMPLVPGEHDLVRGPG